MTSKCQKIISIQAIQRNSSKVFIKIKSHKMKLLQLDLTFQHRDMKLLLTYQFVLTWEMQYDDDDVNFLFVFILNNFSISNISKGMSLENLYTFAFDFLRVKMSFLHRRYKETFICRWRRHCCCWCRKKSTHPWRSRK